MMVTVSLLMIGEGVDFGLMMGSMTSFAALAFDGLVMGESVLG